MAELADALDLGSSGTPVQVQVLSPAPKMDACRTAIKHLFHFWGGTPVLDVCYANQVLFRLRRMLLPAPDTEDCFTEIKDFFIFGAELPSLMFAYANQVLFRLWRMLLPAPNSIVRTQSNQGSYFFFTRDYFGVQILR